MKRCTLLPVVDNVDGAIAYKVFNLSERELQSSTWCSYRSNTELLNVFSSYRGKLKEYLSKPEVMKIVSDKLNVGSIFKVEVLGAPNGLKVSMIVYNDTGDTKYFEKSETIDGQKIEDIQRIIKSWIKDYSKVIPYDGIITGVLGSQITFDVGRSRNFVKGQKFKVRKLNSVKKHPLLNSVVEWDSELIAQGMISKSYDGQAVGMTEPLMKNYSAKKGDWIIVDEVSAVRKSDYKKAFDSKENDDYSFGKLGIISAFLEGMNHSIRSNDGLTRKASGILLGMSLKAELWITREYFGIFEYGIGFGNLKKSTDNLINDSYSLNPNRLKLMGGYRFLPMKYFFGPRFDLYAGYGSYSYKMDLSASEGFGELVFKGLALGMKIDLPIVKSTRAFAKAEVLLSNSVDDADSIFNGNGTGTSLEFEIGARYQWATRLFFDGGLQIISNKAKFDSSSFNEVQFQSTSVKLGMSYLF